MKTLLVPVDFSATADNAVNFAIEWCKQYDFNCIILLKTFYDSMFENIIVAAEYNNVNEENLNRERQDAIDTLHNLCHEVAEKAGPGVEVRTAISEEPLLRAIMDVIESKKPDLVVIGSDNFKYSNDSFIAGHAIDIARISPVRVLIVPANATYKPIKNVLVPCDLNTLSIVDKINSLKASSHWDDIELEVLNVDPKERYLQPDEKFKEAENKVHNYLKNFNHQLHYTNDKSVIDGIAKFTKNNDIQLIIALPGKHSFVYSLTHKSISEAIYRKVYCTKFLHCTISKVVGSLIIRKISQLGNELPRRCICCTCLNFIKIIQAFCRNNYCSILLQKIVYKGKSHFASCT